MANSEGAAGGVPGTPVVADLTACAIGGAYLPVAVGGRPVIASVDLGTDNSWIHPSLLHPSFSQLDEVDLGREPQYVVRADGSQLQIWGTAMVTLTIPALNKTVEHPLLVVPLAVPVVLGRDFFISHGWSVSFENGIMHLKVHS